MSDPWADDPRLDPDNYSGADTLEEIADTGAANDTSVPDSRGEPNAYEPAEVISYDMIGIKNRVEMLGMSASEKRAYLRETFADRTISWSTFPGIDGPGSYGVRDYAADIADGPDESTGYVNVDAWAADDDPNSEPEPDDLDPNAEVVRASGEVTSGQQVDGDSAQRGGALGAVSPALLLVGAGALAAIGGVL